MNVLVTGAQFNNKGAQSLLFTVMSQLRNQYDDVEIYYLPIDDCFSYTPGIYKFNIVFDDKRYCDYFAQKENLLKNLIGYSKLYLKWILRHKKLKIFKLTKVLNCIDVVVDVSGFSLSSKINRKGPFGYLRRIKMATKKNIPVILMPQSFGPFDYDDKKELICDNIRKTLISVDKIFARESEGADMLTQIGVTKNIEISTDLVLQSDEIDVSNVFIKPHELEFKKLATQNNVGIVPNMQLYKHGKKEDLLDVYKNIINHLLNCDKNVYIFRHSNDLPICKDIYEVFKSSERVYFIEDDMNCLEYGEFVKQFDFIVASRFHAIVHAYKENVPAIILGWAVKYHELAKNLNQEKFVFDGTNISNDNKDSIINGIEYMSNNFYEESKIISERMVYIKSQNCYEKCKDIFESIIG